MTNLLITTSVKERMDRIFSDPFSLLKLIGLLLTGIAIGAIVVFDPLLATFMDEHYWSLMLMYETPFKVSLITAVLICVTGVLIAWAARATEFRDIQIVAMLISLQLVAVGAGGVDPIDLLAAAFTALIIGYALANPTHPIKIPLLVYFAVAIAIVDLPHAILEPPLRFMVGLIKYSKSAILPLILVHIVANERLARLFVKALIAVSFVSATIGILQVVYYSFTGIPLVIVNSMDEAFKPTPWGMMLRAHGLNPETHTLSSFLLVTFPFAVYAVATSSSRRRFLWTGTVALTIMMGIFFTWSYGGIIGVFVILVLFPMFMWPHKTIHYLLGLLLIPVFLYATDLIKEIYIILQNEASMSTGILQRKWLLLIALEELGRNPWIGRGFETVGFFSGNWTGRTVHNAYIEAWTYLGPIGFVLFTSMMFIFTTATFILGFSGSREQEYRLRMTSLALIAFMTLMISEPKLYAASTWVLLGFAQALILIFKRNSDSSRSTDLTLAIVGRAHRLQRKKHHAE